MNHSLGATTYADRTDLAINSVGIAGEYLVCADLIVQGWHAFRAEGVAYDVLAQGNGHSLRVQVKSTFRPESTSAHSDDALAYRWRIRRMGTHGKTFYLPGEFDLLALVAVDIKRIAYVVPDIGVTTVSIRPPESSRRGLRFDDLTLQLALAKMEEQP